VELSAFDGAHNFSDARIDKFRLGNKPGRGFPAARFAGSWLHRLNPLKTTVQVWVNTVAPDCPIATAGTTNCCESFKQGEKAIIEGHGEHAAGMSLKCQQFVTCSIGIKTCKRAKLVVEVRQRRTRESRCLPKPPFSEA